MGHVIVKLAEDEYVEWSSIVDAPVSFVLTREQMVRYRPPFGDAPPVGEERVARADAQGTSSLDDNSSAEEYVAFNRAGPKESCLTLNEIRQHYHSSYTEQAMHRSGR